MPPQTAAINGVGVSFTLSDRTDHSLPLSKLPLLQRMASNNNDKRKMEEVAESSMVRKRLWHTDDDSSDDDSSDSSEEEPEEETSMNQLDTFEEKLYARRARGYLFGDDGDTPSMLPDTPPTPESHRCFDEESSDDDDDDDF
jgi:hypothetical protein